MKLWKAMCEVEVLIASVDEPDSFAIRDAAEDEVRDNGDCGFVTTWPAEEVTSLADIPKRWLGSVPQGAADDLTCEQIVEQAIAARKLAAWNAPMPNQTELPLTE